MNIINLLNKVLPIQTSQRMLSSAPDHPAFIAGSNKNLSTQQAPQIIPVHRSSDNSQKNISQSQSKEKLANASFQKTLEQQVTPQKPDDISQTLGTNPTAQQFNTDSASQNSKSEILIKNCAVSCSLPIETVTTPVDEFSSVTPSQLVNTPQLLIPDFSIDLPQSPSQNQPSHFQTDSFPQNQPILSNQPTLITSTLITSPDNSSAPRPLTENPPSPEQPFIGNISTNALNPNIILETKSIELTSIKVSIQNQETQSELPSSSNFDLDITDSLSDQNSPAESSDDTPNPQLINTDKKISTSQQTLAGTVEQSKLNHLPSIGHYKSKSITTNQHSAVPEVNLQAPSSSRQLTNSQLSYGTTADSLQKIDFPKSKLQNIDATVHIVRDSTLPVSNVGLQNNSSTTSVSQPAPNLTTISNDPAGVIREQISQSVTLAAQQPNHRITVELNPPELGKVFIKFSKSGSELTGLIEASSPRTRTDINLQIPEIIRSLELAGISIKRIDVTLSDPQERSLQDPQRDYSYQFNDERHNSGSYYHSSNHSFVPDSYTIPPQYSSASLQYQPQTTTHQTLNAASSLNILI